MKNKKIIRFITNNMSYIFAWINYFLFLMLWHIASWYIPRIKTLEVGECIPFAIFAYLFCFYFIVSGIVLGNAIERKIKKHE